jgi:C4-dicarboxylate-specific signal transduction histidine kinase
VGRSPGRRPGAGSLGDVTRIDRHRLDDHRVHRAITSPSADLGDVVDSVENNRLASRYNGQQVVTLTIQRQPGTNTVAVVDAIRNLLPAFRQQLPASIKLDVLYDRSESIRESVDDVQYSLLLAIGLVVLVIFLFLRNLRATADALQRYYQKNGYLFARVDWRRERLSAENPTWIVDRPEDLVEIALASAPDQ